MKKVLIFSIVFAFSFLSYRVFSQGLSLNLYPSSGSSYPNQTLNTIATATDIVSSQTTVTFTCQYSPYFTCNIQPSSCTITPNESGRVICQYTPQGPSCTPVGGSGSSDSCSVNINIAPNPTDSPGTYNITIIASADGSVASKIFSYTIEGSSNNSNNNNNNSNNNNNNNNNNSGGNNSNNNNNNSNNNNSNNNSGGNQPSNNNQNSNFEVIGYGYNDIDSINGNTVLSLSLPSGASIYICNAGGSPTLSSVSWNVQQESSVPGTLGNLIYTSLGYQNSGECSINVPYLGSSYFYGFSLGGIAIVTDENYTFQGTTYYFGSQSQSTSYNYNVNEPSNVVISVACGYSSCSSINVPSGCQVLVDNSDLNSLGTSFIAVCYNQSPGTYQVSISNPNGIASIGIYEFSSSSPSPSPSPSPPPSPSPSPGPSPSNSGFSIVGYNSTTYNTGSPGPISESISLPSANLYLCNGATSNYPFSSVSWNVQESEQDFSSLGYQSSNVCSATVGSATESGYFVTIGGVAIDTNENYIFQGTTYDQQGKFSYSYTLNTTSNVVISLACGNYGCTSINVPSGCQVLVDKSDPYYFTTSFFAVCYNQSPGTYTISGNYLSASALGLASLGIYEFPSSNSSTNSTNQTSSPLSITLNPSSGYSSPGGSASTEAVVNVVTSGYTHLRFSCNAPSGISCLFPDGNNAYVDHSTTIDWPVNISSSSNTPSGTYNITVTVSGYINGQSQSASATFTYTVQQSSSQSPLSLTLNQSSGSSSPGQSLYISAEAVYSLGGHQKITFSCSAPSNDGISCSFPYGNYCYISHTGTGYPGECNVIVDISSSSNTPSGTYTVTISASTNGYSSSQSFSYTVQQSSNNQPPSSNNQLSLTLSPSSGSSSPGGSASTTADVSSSTLSTGTRVDFICNAPSGFTCSFPDGKYCTIYSGSCSIPINITSSSSVSPGTYSITIEAFAHTGTSSTVSTSSTFTYTVQQSSSSEVGLSLSPSSGYSSPGGSAYTQAVASLTKKLGNYDEVQFSCSAPSNDGISCSFPNGNICYIKYSSCGESVKISSSSSTPVGTYTVTITASVYVGQNLIGSASQEFTYHVKYSRPGNLASSLGSIASTITSIASSIVNTIMHII
ncbi:hypothetical protein YN1_2240 [Nanoarchaeota archaeon]